MALSGKKVLEFAGLAPAPFAGMLLADNGASVIRVDRPFATTLDVLCRGKRSIAINSKIPSGRELLKRLVASSDILIDPFRPGVLERLGLGPEVFLGSSGLNQQLIYARIVGFPRTGPHKNMAGHDLNYLALSGVLSMLPGSVNKPAFPLNLLADFAGGGMHCVTKILLALLMREQTSRGQVVDVDMVSGTRYISSSPLIHRLHPSTGRFPGKRGTNLLDGGAPFYNIYTCKDGGLMTVACIEPRFFKNFLERFCEALPKDFTSSEKWQGVVNDSVQESRELWPTLQLFLETGFSMLTRDEWGKVFFGTDACSVPVLTPEEASELSSSLGSAPQIAFNDRSASCFLNPGEHTREVLVTEFGVPENEYERLLEEGAIGESK
ncbi:CoA-transferase family III domain-containing protein [Rhodocollybia butyracea]|uniref:CoA-transferase family III domain-containing protein n=1 Tax=Rhodocollybia butyracea TaxID=206335 RepID=A0A9P5U6U6_9AGAR|nr:CoA-transferase family III domain-containing protein [Rhodocollybia butyracea]